MIKNRLGTVVLDSKVVRQDPKWNWKLFHCHQWREAGANDLNIYAKAKEIKAEVIHAKSA